MVLGIYLAPLLWIGRAGCVLFSEGSVEDGAGFDNGLGDGAGDKTLTVSSMVKSCLAGVDPFLPCINERAMAAIEQTESMDTVRLDEDLEIARQHGDEAAVPRGTYSFGDNPYNIGAVVEAASSLLSRRTFCWDISALYPGLQMRIGPTYSGKGIIDFIVDPRRKFDERSLGYGQMIFKRSFLPNVLATQITIASVIPLIFAAIYVLTKKAFILSKIALVVTSVIGYGSLFLHHGSKLSGHSFDGKLPIFGHQPTEVVHHPHVHSHHPPVVSHHPPIVGHHPIGGHHNGFIGDIRGDKFYGNFDSFQQISSSKPGSLFRGVNFFPKEDHNAYKDLDERSKKEME